MSESVWNFCLPASCMDHTFTYMYIIAQWFEPCKNVEHITKIFFCLCWSLNLGPQLTQQFSTPPIDHYPEPVLRNVIFLSLPHLEHPNQTWSSSGAQTHLTAWINRFELLNIYKNTTRNFVFQTIAFLNMCYLRSEVRTHLCWLKINNSSTAPLFSEFTFVFGKFSLM